MLTRFQYLQLHSIHSELLVGGRKRPKHNLLPSIKILGLPSMDLKRELDLCLELPKNFSRVHRANCVPTFQIII
jgi:hypothetical protein